MAQSVPHQVGRCRTSANISLPPAFPCSAKVYISVTPEEALLIKGAHATVERADGRISHSSD